MPYIIDGHNLIPKVPGLSLQDIEDEMQLVSMLQEFCRINRKEVEVFFDNAPPGGSTARNHGRVVARFVREGGTADHAIKQKLKRLGGEARNWTVVSSDREVQVNARALRANVIPSEVFAQRLVEILTGSGELQTDSDDELSSDEVDDWMQIFGYDEND